MIHLYLGTEDIHVLGVKLKRSPSLDAALEVHRHPASLRGAPDCGASYPAIVALLLLCEVDLFDNL